MRRVAKHTLTFFEFNALAALLVLRDRGPGCDRFWKSAWAGGSMR